MVKFILLFGGSVNNFLVSVFPLAVNKNGRGREILYELKLFIDVYAVENITNGNSHKSKKYKCAFSKDSFYVSQLNNINKTRETRFFLIRIEKKMSKKSENLRSYVQNSENW